MTRLVTTRKCGNTLFMGDNARYLCVCRAIVSRVWFCFRMMSTLYTAVFTLTLSWFLYNAHGQGQRQGKENETRFSISWLAIAFMYAEGTQYNCVRMKSFFRQNRNRLGRNFTDRRKVTWRTHLQTFYAPCQSPNRHKMAPKTTFCQLFVTKTTRHFTHCLANDLHEISTQNVNLRVAPNFGIFVKVRVISKSAWSILRHVTYFYNFGTPFTFLEWVKLEPSKLVCALTSRPTNQKMQS